MPMKDTSFKTPQELQTELGKRLRELRLQRNLDKRATAEKAGIAEKSLRNLETGRGSSVETLLRTLKALDYLEGIEMLAPKPSVNPLALLRTAKPRSRARHRRREKPQ
jgi:transcriptional regulator with XRE-family HTH domain